MTASRKIADINTQLSAMNSKVDRLLASADASKPKPPQYAVEVVTDAGQTVHHEATFWHVRESGALDVGHGDSYEMNRLVGTYAPGTWTSVQRVKVEEPSIYERWLDVMQTPLDQDSQATAHSPERCGICADAEARSFAAILEDSVIFDDPGTSHDAATIVAPNPLTSDIDWSLVESTLGVKIIQSPLQSDVIHSTTLGERERNLLRPEADPVDGVCQLADLVRLGGVPEVCGLLRAYADVLSGLVQGLATGEHGASPSSVVGAPEGSDVAGSPSSDPATSSDGGA